MKGLIRSLVVVFACAASGAALNDSAYAAGVAESQKPDFASMDKPVLVYLASQQFDKIQNLEARVAELKAKIAAGHGGSEAVVVDDVIAVKNGSWVVTIQSVGEPDVTPFEQEIKDLRHRLNGDIVTGGYNQPALQTGVEARLRDAERGLQSLMGRGKYRRMVSSSGHVNQSDSNLNGYSDKQLNDAKTAVRRLKGEKQGIDRKILDLKRRIEVQRNTFTAQGVTDDGIPVTIKSTGVYAQVGHALQVGKTYTVTGRGQFNANSGKITVKTATEIQVAADVAVDAE